MNFFISILVSLQPRLSVSVSVCLCEYLLLLQYYLCVIDVDVVVVVLIELLLVSNIWAYIAQEHNSRPTHKTHSDVSQNSST